MERRLREAVSAAAARPEAVAAVGRVYAQLQAEIDRRRPRCEASGRCCRFEQYGHRLYVTTLELAAFLSHLPVASCQLSVRKTPLLPVLATDDRQPATPWDGTGCPYQAEGLCGVHAIRPFGCRVFFCDETSTEWQQEQYEHFHAALKRLHGELGVPYLYVEWREALRLLGLEGAWDGVSRTQLSL